MKLVAPLAVAAAMAVVGADPVPSKPIDAKGFRYTGGSSGEAAIDGVCKLGGKRPICWKPDGAPNTDLDREVNEEIPMFKDLAQAPKSRLALFVHCEAPRSTPFVNAGIGKTVNSFAPGPFMASTGPSAKNPALLMRCDLVCWIPEGTKGRTIDAFIRYARLLADKRLPVGTGASARIADVMVKFDRFEVQNASDGTKKTEKATCSEVVSFPGGFPGNEISFAPEFVDRNGKTVPQDAESQAGHSLDNGRSFEATWSMKTSVPEKVAAIDLHPAQMQVVKFHGISLRPKR